MTQLCIVVATGTVATIMATLLLLARVKIHGQPPLLALARKWESTSAYTSSLVIAPFAVVAVSCFAGILESNFATFAAQNSSSEADGEASTAQAIESLRAYANSAEPDRGMTSAQASSASTGALPDVDTMIAKLVAKLEQKPNDVNGWKMLGWSYLNTSRLTDAIKAYETALKLAPADPAIERALSQARSARNAPTSSMLATQQAPDDMGYTASQTNVQQSEMIRGMVDKLAARLDASPNDENGWLRLMSSRMTLGDKDAAEAALKKAMVIFVNDKDAKTRLAKAARELGIANSQ